MKTILALSTLLLVACNINEVTPTGDAGKDANADGQPLVPIDKVDILIMDDNSTSMAPNQELMAQAVGAFLTELTLEIKDIHVGFVTSSLGSGGADNCIAGSKITAQEDPLLTKFDRHNDDRGHLINRIKPDRLNPPASGIEDPVTDAQPSNFLAWLPSQTPTPPVKPITSLSIFTDDFAKLATGAGALGCGLEAQLESWYRFLVQPDPWESITLDNTQNPAVAQLQGYDDIILSQRHDFLRPDSLVVVLVVTDEEDSWSDPMWLKGHGWMTRGLGNPFSSTGQLPRGTQACDAPVDPQNPATTGPNDPACKWCGLKGTENDPNCATNKGVYSPKDDGLNVRYVNDMKRRYGMDPQFPVQRYVDGLKSDKVPDRKGEHFDANGTLMDEYVGRKNCTNPLYAKTLPTSSKEEMCALERGPRSPDQVVFALIGGVSPHLLITNPQNPQSAFKRQLASADWEKIIGKDPAHYLTDGIDPHMLESINPRAGISCGLGSPNNCDATHGREWDTSTSKVGIDLQYACTYPLPKSLDCSKLPDSAGCDCGATYAGPLCEPNMADMNNPTLQTRGKAFPTIRELRVAHDVGDAIVGSICKQRPAPDDVSYASVFAALRDRVVAIREAHKM